MKSQKIKDRIWLQTNGRIYALPLVSKHRKTQEEEQDLCAPFACKVLKVAIHPGQKLQKGDLVVVVEAMKMEYSYYSPKTGEVASVLIKEGQILSSGEAFLHWKDS